MFVVMVISNMFCLPQLYEEILFFHRWPPDLFYIPTHRSSLRGKSSFSSIPFLIPKIFPDIFVDDNPIPPQSEVKCSAGTSVKFGIKICNLSPSSLENLTLTMQFYQDYQNGVLNYKLETRVILSGPDRFVYRPGNRFSFV